MKMSVMSRKGVHEGTQQQAYGNRCPTKSPQLTAEQGRGDTQNVYQWAGPEHLPIGKDWRPPAVQVCGGERWHRGGWGLGTAIYQLVWRDISTSTEPVFTGVSLETSVGAGIPSSPMLWLPGSQDE